MDWLRYHIQWVLGTFQNDSPSHQNLTIVRDTALTTGPQSPHRTKIKHTLNHVSYDKLVTQNNKTLQITPYKHIQDSQPPFHQSTLSKKKKKKNQTSTTRMENRINSRISIPRRSQKTQTTLAKNQDHHRKPPPELARPRNQDIDKSSQGGES